MTSVAFSPPPDDPSLQAAIVKAIKVTMVIIVQSRRLCQKKLNVFFIGKTPFVIIPAKLDRESRRLIRPQGLAYKTGSIP
jgi:hypothetical protein